MFNVAKCIPYINPIWDCMDNGCGNHFNLDRMCIYVSTHEEWDFISYEIPRFLDHFDNRYIFRSIKCLILIVLVLFGSENKPFVISMDSKCDHQK